MISFKDFLEEDGIDYFVIEISSELLNNLETITEGRWVESGKKDYMLRIDAEDPATNQQRHVHVAKSKHINSKTMQASWNEDGSKHDKKTFNSKIGSLKAVQSIARDALNLPPAVKLEEASKSAQLISLCESINESTVKTGVFRAVLA